MEELVKRLRCQHFGNCPNCHMWYAEEVEPNLWRERCAAIEAADAIEELSNIREEQKAQIILMAAEDKPRWIPVTEQLPKDLTFVLAIEDGTVFMAHCEHYYGEEEVFIEWHDTMYYPVSPSHWMPIPQPPEEGEA